MGGGGGGVVVTVKEKRGEEMDFKHLYVKGFCVELEGIDWLECS